MGLTKKALIERSNQIISCLCGLLCVTFTAESQRRKVGAEIKRIFGPDLSGQRRTCAPKRFGAQAQTPIAIGGGDQKNIWPFFSFSTY